MKVKKIIALCITLWITSTGFAQEIEYLYDNAGNRVLRQIYVLRSSPAGNEEAVENLAPLQLEDRVGEFEFTLFPNPTRDVLNISVNDLFLAEKNKEVSVTDLNGKLLVKQKVQDRVTNLDFSTYTPGSYIVRISSEGQKVREWKIIRE